MPAQDERKKRALRAGRLQVLWALLLVYLILAGVAILFSRSVGYGISFGVCGGIAALVTAAFLAIYLIDRATASLVDRRQQVGDQPKHGACR